MPSKYTKILEFNQYQKSDKAPFVIYADLECLIKKRLIGVKIILKNHLQQKYVNIFHQVFQSTITPFKSIKISMIYTEIKIA